MATAVYDTARPGVVEIVGAGAENRIVPLGFGPRPPAPCSLAGSEWYLYPGAEWRSDRGGGRWEAAVFRFPGR